MITLEVSDARYDDEEMEKPAVKSYLSVTQYLKDFYLYRKANDVGFSYQTWAEEIGFDNRAYLRLVVSGKRPLNENLTNKILHRSLLLIPDEEKYFLTLVNYCQSKNQEQRRVFGLQLAKCLDAEADQEEIAGHFDFLSNPLMPRLQTLLSFEDLDKSQETLGELLAAESAELKAALDKLESMGLAIKKETSPGNFQWIASQRSWKVPTQFRDLGLREFYRNSLARAEEAIQMPVEERRFRSLFVGMNQDEFRDFLSDFEIFVQEQLKKRDVDSLSGRRLYQLNFSFFADSKELDRS